MYIANYDNFEIFMTKFGNLVLFSMGGFWNPWIPPDYVPDNMPLRAACNRTYKVFCVQRKREWHASKCKRGERAGGNWCVTGRNMFLARSQC
jgi:hypothetical protein